MIEAQASKTALRVALRRAAHQVRDARPLVFEDPLAVRILGTEHEAELQRTPSAERRPFSGALRAFVVARARVAEDELAAAYARGVRQYVVLGAGLDTFAYRNPWANLRAFEVDHPATQAWKRERLAAAGLLVPDNARLVAVDFERQELGAALREAGFDAAAPVVTAWLGVAPYLTVSAFRETLKLLGRFSPGSRVVLDYAQPREVLSANEQLMLDSLSARVQKAGEPFQLFFTPQALQDELTRAGLAVVSDRGSKEMNMELFAGRADALELRGDAGRICVAGIAAS